LAFSLKRLTFVLSGAGARSGWLAGERASLNASSGLPGAADCANELISASPLADGGCTGEKLAAQTIGSPLLASLFPLVAGMIQEIGSFNGMAPI